MSIVEYIQIKQSYVHRYKADYFCRSIVYTYHSSITNLHTSSTQTTHNTESADTV